ncbi:MAG: phosphoenolpyruvate synthase, partial [Muribaculaceae bacterium]|nr:phosphoenolpyruvate synthase [Muribaculaceae bacterium]
ALRFSPHHPSKVLQTSTLDLALRDTQTRMLALDMTDNAPCDFTADDGFNLRSLRVQQAAADGSLKYMVSTFDINDQIIRDTDAGPGRKVVTFANMLNHGSFPLAEAAAFMLETGQREMARPVEIEFAGVVNGASDGTIYWLQIRPIVDKKEMGDEQVLALDDDKTILRSTTALGNGNIEGVATVVYVRPEAFNSANTQTIAREIEKLNRQFLDNSEPYMLIGPGRWGTSDPALGIPVKWPHISGARLIVEASLPGYRIEPSQGTHFFQNLTSVGAGYFTIDVNSGHFDIACLDAQPAFYESPNLRVVRFEAPLAIALNGRTGLGVVAKPKQQNP